ncbi:MAG: hypothetical protein A2Y86_05585 [Candidatus Aminicenantes bacterium RBG_13_62_12]|nr:MAG: hypothetical protein A2Y86_05585 [Candidatus Aminicenantes bacterium RBG_13_62_12]
MFSRIHIFSKPAGMTAPALLLAALCAAGLSGSAPSGEIIDCLLARVNDQPVTLLEVRILETFGLFREETVPSRRALLDKWIELKIVIDLVKERMSISPERIAAARDEALAGLGPEKAEAAFQKFGLTADDLLPYFEQKLVFQEIIFMRFSRSTIVTLREIEGYYEETYIVEERNRGAEPRPILEVLDRLEDLLKNEKIKRQAASWVQNLRRQADVQILETCLNALDRM